MKRHLFAPGPIHVKNRRSWKARVLFEQTERLSIFPERREKTYILFSREPDHAQLRDHNRPTEDGCDGQKSENELACDRCVIESKQETAAGRYDFRNEHSRVTRISNNAVSGKRKKDSNPKARISFYRRLPREGRSPLRRDNECRPYCD